MTAAAAAVAAATRRVIRQLQGAGTVSPETAVAFVSTRRLDGRRLQSLLRQGVVVEAGAGLYWIDEAALAAWRERMRMRLVIVLLIVAAAVAAVLLWRMVGA